MPQTVTNEVITMPEPSNRQFICVRFGPGRTGAPVAAAGFGRGGSAAAAEKPQADSPSTEVFAVYGVEPEIQAYAMAKYSRSSLSMKESLREISAQKAEKFLNTFLLSVWPPLDCRPGAHCAGRRAALDSRGDRTSRRAALGRAGALDPLSGLQKERLLHA